LKKSKKSGISSVFYQPHILSILFQIP